MRWGNSRDLFVEAQRSRMPAHQGTTSWKRHVKRQRPGWALSAVVFLRRVRLFVRLPQFNLCVKMRYRARTNFGFCWWACVMRPTVCRYDINRRSLLAFLALISACLIPFSSSLSRLLLAVHRRQAI